MINPADPDAAGRSRRVAVRGRRAAPAVAAGALAMGALLLAAATRATPAHTDAVQTWFSATQALVARVPPASDAIAEQALPMTALAMYDAAVAVDGGFKPYAARIEAPPAASAEAAVHAAAHAMLTRLFPADAQRLDAVYAEGLLQLGNHPGRAAGIRIGRLAARQVFDARGLDAVREVTTYRPETPPGKFVPPQLPAREWVGRLRPFVIDLESFRSAGPPSLASAEYHSDFEEVRVLGGRRSTARSAEQGAVARFWHSADLSQLMPQAFTRPGRSLVGNARLLAAYATAQFDAGIVLTREKYRHDFWRPVTAIRNADQDDNPATTRDAEWEPLLSTPSHPDYPCGHCMVGALVAGILEPDIGAAPANGILVTSGGEVRRFTTFAQMAEEASDSRVWGGVHFRKGARDGAAMGREMARTVLENAFPPLQ